MIIYPNGTDTCITVVYKTMGRGRYVVAWSTYARFTDHSAGPNKFVLAMFREGEHHRSMHYTDIKQRDAEFLRLVRHRIDTCMGKEVVWP